MSGEYSRARDAEDDHTHHERVQAARTVAGNARDVDDLQLLLSVLGLDAADGRGDRDLPVLADPMSVAPAPRRPIEDDGFG